MQRLTDQLVGLSLARGRAPAWVRERVPVGAGARRWMLDELGDLAPERLVLHTCERFEVYAAAEDWDQESCLRRVGNWLTLEPEVLAPHVRLRRADEVVAHLLRVTSGLESRLVGEHQIRSQVRQAFGEARAASAVGPLMDALVRAALHTGRVVRRETLLGQGTSVVSLAVARLRAELGTLHGRSVLVAGRGSLAAQVVAALTVSAARVAVTSRGIEGAEALATRFDAVAVPPGDLGRAVARADALVACTYGRVPIEPTGVGGRPFSIVDLGMPPNIDPALAAQRGVRLTRLDDLTASDAGPERVKAARLAAEETVQFLRSWTARRARALEMARLGEGPAA